MAAFGASLSQGSPSYTKTLPLVNLKTFFLAPILAFMLTTTASASQVEHARFTGAQAQVSVTPRLLPSPFFLHLDLIPKVICKDGEGTKLGTAFVVDRDTYATAFHVVSGKATSCTINGETAKVSYFDPNLDYAILSSPTGATFDRMVIDCGGYRDGVRYTLAGYPLGAFAIEWFTGTADNGSNGDGTALIMGHAYAGFSGGPVVNDEGHVVGLMNARQADGIPYAFTLPMSQTILCKRGR